MSTSTDVRERASEQERSTINQLTATGLTLVSAGFALYPTRTDKTDRRVVMGVAFPEAERHTPLLVVQKSSVLGKIPHGIPKSKIDFPDLKHFDLHFLDVTDFDLSSPDAQSSAGATAIAFDMIPDFESFSSGLHLASDWRERISSWHAFDGGELVAVPDNNTLTQTCHWTDFAKPPQDHDQSFTSCTAYARSVQKSRSIVLTSRDDATKHVLSFKEEPVFAAFINYADVQDSGNYAVDFDHINAMFRLCDKYGEVRFTLGEMKSKKMTVPTPEFQDPGWPEWLAKLRQINTFAGRPHCSARQMQAPMEA
jgi:hypothetical protein